MKNLIKPVLLASAVVLSFGAQASTTDASQLAACKSQVKSQFEAVTKIDVASMNSRRNLFKAKLRVKAGGERAMVLCEIRGDQPVALSCLKGDACDVSSVASN